MKKLFPLFLLGCVVVIGSVKAEESQKSSETTTMYAIRNALITDANKMASSVALYYTVKDKEKKQIKLFIRSKDREKVRIDWVSDGEFASGGWDGKNAWGCDNVNSGVYDMPENEFDSMMRDISFLPIFIRDSERFSELIKIGTENVGDEKCTIYSAKKAEDKSNLRELRIWVNSQNVPLKMETEETDGFFLTTFEKYRKISGVLVPAVVRVATDDFVYTFSLKSAMWRVTLENEMFSKPESVENCSKNIPNIEGTIVQTPRKKEPLAAEKKQKKIAKYNLEIEQLKIKIHDDEEQLSKMESVFSENKKNMTVVAATPVKVRWRSSWRKGRRNGSGKSSFHSSSRVNNSMLRNIKMENSEILKEYSVVRKRLLNNKLHLAEVEALLLELQQQ